MRRDRHFAARALQQGISLIEMMVGVVIGLVAVLVIYQTFAVAEGVKRQTISAGDAQKAGMIAMYLLGTEIGNAGSGITNNRDDLAFCTFSADVKATLRAFPVLITPGADAATPDSIVVHYSTARSVVTPSMLMDKTDAGGTTYTVQSPTGFKKGDMVLPINPNGNCERIEVTDVSAPDGNGNVILTQAGSKYAYKQSMLVVNLGPAGSTQRVLYDVSGSVLRSTDLVKAGAVAQPLMSSIMNLKMQYGVDNNADGKIDAWEAPAGAYAPAAVLAFTPNQMRRIKAVRVGMILRSDEYDRDAPAFDWSLLGCTAQEAKDYTCPDAITGTLPANYRYRVYETVIPMRNPIWNR